MFLCCSCLASGDRSRDSSAKERVSSILHAANKRIRRSRDKSSGRTRESGERDGSVSEPASYSERNIDHEVELRQLQELLQSGRTAQPVEADKRTATNDNSVILSPSASSAESSDAVPVSKTADLPARRECAGSSVLKERRKHFLQNGCSRLTGENGESKRYSVDVGQLIDGLSSDGNTTAATCVTTQPFTPVLPSTSEPGDRVITVPSSSAIKMQRAVEQHMQQLADDLQRTFIATTTSSLPGSSEPSVEVRPPVVASCDAAAKFAADSQSVTSDYSTMSSVGGGQDDCRRNRLVSVDVEIPVTLGFDSRKVADRSTIGRRRNRGEAALSTPRSQSSGNFSLANSEPAGASLYTSSTMELSQDSIDSAADHSDQLSLSLSSQMSGSQILDSDDVLRTGGTADKHSCDPPLQPSGIVGQKAWNVDSSSVPSAADTVEQFGVMAGDALALQSDADTHSSVVQRHSNATKSDSETAGVLDKSSCAVNRVRSENQDAFGANVGVSTAEVQIADRVPVEPCQSTPVEKNTDCSHSTGAGQVSALADSDDKRLSTHSSREQFLQSRQPAHRLVRRHTLGGTGDLSLRVADPRSQSPVGVQSADSHGDEERLSAWQRLKPAVKDPLPNFGTWLATQRQLHHVRSSPALLVGVALMSASQLNCQSFV